MQTKNPWNDNFPAWVFAVYRAEAGSVMRNSKAAAELVATPRFVQFKFRNVINQFETDLISSGFAQKEKSIAAFAIRHRHKRSISF